MASQGFVVLAEILQKPDGKPSSFVEGLRDIQSQYMMLADLYEKQKSYAARLTEIVKTLQAEADETIPLRPQLLGEKISAAYLASEAVVIMFDVHRHMTSKPLEKFPAEVIVSAIEDTTGAISKMISEKRRLESSKVESLERALKEMKKAQATFRQAKAEDPHIEPPRSAEAAKPEPVSQEPVETHEVAREPEPEAIPAEQPEVASPAFSFRGSYGDRSELEGLTN